MHRREPGGHGPGRQRGSSQIARRDGLPDDDELAVAALVALALRLSRTLPGRQPAAARRPVARRRLPRQQRRRRAPRAVRLRRSGRVFRQALRMDPALDIARVNLAIALFYAGPERCRAAGGGRERAAATGAAGALLLGLVAQGPGIGWTRRSRAFDECWSSIQPTRAAGQPRADPAAAAAVYAEAIAAVREALAAEPFNVTAAYGLATALTRSGNAEEAGEAMERFESLRDSAYGVTYAPVSGAGTVRGSDRLDRRRAGACDRSPPAVTFARQRRPR